VFAVADHLNSVDEDLLHSDCVLVRSFVGRFIRDRLWIENNYVGKVAFLKQALATPLLRWQYFHGQS
jgi:hypothetical protein